MSIPSMNIAIIVVLFLVGIYSGILVSPQIQAQNWYYETEKIDENKTGIEIPEGEFIGFFDSNMVYTVVGVIKNHEPFAITPTIIINIQDGIDENVISEIFQLGPIPSQNELPFKLRFPQVNDLSPTLKEPRISYIPSYKEPLKVNVIYDETLIQHEDGHITGRVINDGDKTVHNVKIFAVIHGQNNKTLDMGQNIKRIEKIDPGEIIHFEMYPDPSIADQVQYYSCFAPSDTTIVPVYTTRNENKFYYRYDSGTWYYNAQFNEKGTELTMKTYTSFPLETYTNFEFPQFSKDEKFSVYLNGQPKEIVQSLDEQGNWHVIFKAEPNEQGEIRITGFKEGWDPGDKILIPDWIRFNSGWWADSKIDDENFIRGIQFLIKEQIITTTTTTSDSYKNDIVSTDDTVIPDWFRTNAKWWSEGYIDDETFLAGLEFLITHGIIQI
jgi:hypothetical protein